MLNSPVISSELGADYVAFDLNPTRVRESRAQGFPVFYGDGTEPEVLRTAGLDDPKVREGGTHVPSALLLFSSGPTMSYGTSHGRMGYTPPRRFAKRAA